MTSPGLAQLIQVMARLRDKTSGCPWDLEQDFASIAPYTIEEAYEVADAIARGDLSGLKEELGDLLLQVVFHSQMAAEAGHFTFEDVASGIASKMIRRHPHVFGEAEMRDSAAQTRAWEAQKAQERREAGPARTLGGVALALPALLRALKLQKRAAQVGFDWKSAGQVLDKLHEEIGELTEAAEAGAPRERLADEFGDILFVLVNVGRHLGLDPEAALRGTNAKFERRFALIEDALAAEGRGPGDATLAELDALWNRAKVAEKS